MKKNKENFEMSQPTSSLHFWRYFVSPCKVKDSSTRQQTAYLGKHFIMNVPGVIYIIVCKPFGLVYTSDITSKTYPHKRTGSLKESRFPLFRIKYSSQRTKLLMHRWKILHDRDWFLPQSTSVQFAAKTVSLSMQQISLALILQEVL